jgi:hypothetical protein
MQFDIRSYKELKKQQEHLKKIGEIDDDWQVHHLVEKRLIKRSSELADDLDGDDIPSILIPKKLHQHYTDLWRKATGYKGDKNFIPGDIPLEKLMDIAQIIYSGRKDTLKILMTLL